MGQFSTSTTNTGCDPCDVGFFADQAASQRCQVCEAGTYTPITGRRYVKSLLYMLVVLVV